MHVFCFVIILELINHTFKFFNEFLFIYVAASIASNKLDFTNDCIGLRANVLVAELFDTELIGEGAISSFAHAARNLLTVRPVS